MRSTVDVRSIHEAGHICIAVALGLQVTRATLDAVHVQHRRGDRAGPTRRGARRVRWPACRAPLLRADT